jgi:hypothetical protein
MKTFQKATLGGVLLAAVIGGGALTAAALPANAATVPAASGAATSGTPAQTAAPDPTKGGHQANGITETLLTGDTAAKVKAAVLAADPGATIQRMENDAEGAVYEAHILKSDGSMATVKLDASFNVTGTETGGPGGAGGPGAPQGTPGTQGSTNG